MYHKEVFQVKLLRNLRDCYKLIFSLYLYLEG